MPGRRRQLSTLDYSQEDRDRLADAVTKARLAAGIKWRTGLVKAAGVSRRSIDALERGEPGVGQAILYAVGRALPGWNEDTPRLILEGGAPPNPQGDTAMAALRAEVQSRLENVRKHYPDEYNMLMALLPTGEVGDADVDRIARHLRERYTESSPTE